MSSLAICSLTRSPHGSQSWPMVQHTTHNRRTSQLLDWIGLGANSKKALILLSLKNNCEYNSTFFALSLQNMYIFLPHRKRVYERKYFLYFSSGPKKICARNSYKNPKKNSTFLVLKGIVQKIAPQSNVWIWSIGLGFIHKGLLSTRIPRIIIIVIFLSR